MCVCVSSALYSHVRYCKVFDDDVSNVSDHMPISVDLIIPVLNDHYNQCNTGSIQWHRLLADDIKYCYTLPLEEATYRTLRRNEMDLEVIISDISSDYSSVDTN